jgi:SAM-dependent methyltransferase
MVQDNIFISQQAQDDIFLNYEGDAWFNRNAKFLGTTFENDIPLKLIDLFNLKPKKVLDVGAANGYRLAEISRRFGAGNYVAIEPSHEAIMDGQKRFPFIEFRRGLMYDLPLQADEVFDLVIVNFVFHWVSRDKLLSSVSELDKAIADGGFLILGDFLPNMPTKVKYHHLPDHEVFTYKQNYANIFLSSELYTLVAQLTFDHDMHSFNPDIDSNSRGGCSVLRKNKEDLYVMKTFQKNP